MNYGAMKSQFQGILNRRDITPSLSETFMQQAIARCQRELRVPAMEKTETFTIGAGFTSLTIPTDFLELISLESSDFIELSRVSAQVARRTGELISKPRMYARKGGEWFVGPTPEQGDTVRLDYFAEFAPLVADTDSNILSEIAADLPIYCALSYACDYFIDNRAASFEARYLAILNELHMQADADELAGTAVVSPAFQYDCEDF